MGGTYKAAGINLKSMPLGESDRLVSILTPEFGLVRAVAPGARKHNSQFSGRSGLFVVNNLLIAKGRSLDKIIQAETVNSYPGLSSDLGKLSASQYLAEIVLCQALSDQPQAELFSLLNEHLRRLEQLSYKIGDRFSTSLVLAHLSQGIFHLLALAGVVPQVQFCCLTQEPLPPNFSDPDWKIGFSITAGGTVSLSALARLAANRIPVRRWQPNRTTLGISTETEPGINPSVLPETPIKLIAKLNALELALLQRLAQPQISPLQPEEPGRMNHEERPGISTTNHLTSSDPAEETAWVSVEQVLRQYVQYHIGRSIRSAALMDAALQSVLNSF
jgi:DNA repair protein RecO (recombination protein O)